MFNKEKPVKVLIDKEKCTKCGLCVSLCADYLEIKDNELQVNVNSPFGCFQCGNCMMICPNDTIKVVGEGVKPDDVFLLDDKQPTFEDINKLFSKRRSIRNYKNQDISQDIINKILDAASTAPVSIPPSEVKVLVINGRDKVQEFAEDLAGSLMKFQKVMNPFVLKIIGLFMDKVKYKMFKDFVLPLCKHIINGRRAGEDYLFYNAPAVIVFYGSELIDREDALIASVYAEIAAESLGLGTCIIGTVPPALESNRRLREKYGLLKNEKIGSAFILGYPEIKYRRGIKREFKAVRYF